jgi:NAD(P)-dependent dehydrogenase (short-subunit alcohol dehydrogenase family)
MDAMAVSYALEVARFGIESTIVVPGSFTHGTNHFAHSGKPADDGIVAAYETKYAGLMDQVAQKLRELEPEWADVSEVAKAIVTVVDTEKGRRPFRVHIDPSDDGAAVVNAVADRIRSEFLRRVELDDLLHPAA